MKKADSFVISVNGLIYNQFFLALLEGTKQTILETKNIKLVREFVLSALDGDGSIAILKLKRKYPIYNILVRITDENPRYRKDYRDLLSILGFKTMETEKRVFIINSFENLFKLIEIGAFEKRKLQRIRLLFGFLKKRRTRSLEKLERFIQPSIRPIEEAEWVKWQIKYGLIKEQGKSGQHKLFILTQKGREMLNFINSVKQEMEELMIEIGIRDLNTILSLRTKRGSDIIFSTRGE